MFEPLMVLKINLYGWAIAQALGPFKTIASAKNGSGAGQRRFLIFRLKDDSTTVVLRQIVHE
jgi:hypothetical protein